MPIDLRWFLAFVALATSSLLATGDEPRLQKLTDAVPFPRGLALADPDGDGRDMLYVLSRGRSRGDGGADATLDDRAGTLWEVDPITGRATVFAEPTDPPFRLLDRTLDRAIDDDKTDRPYCLLRWDERTRSFFICAFSGIDLPADGQHGAESGYFKKNLADAVLRYDVDEERWHVVDRHEPRFGEHYPAATEVGEQGWVRGPDNAVVIGDTLIVAAKDNDRLVAYHLPTQMAAAAPGVSARVVLADRVTLANRNGEQRTVRGHSALATDDDWLHVGFRTTGEVIRLPIVDDGRQLSLDTDAAELLATLQPFDPDTGDSANITDIALGPAGDLFVLSAKPARVFRFTPDPTTVCDYRDGTGAWLDAAAASGDATLKSENLLVAPDGTVFLTSGNPYGATGIGGIVWVLRPSSE